MVEKWIWRSWKVVSVGWVGGYLLNRSSSSDMFLTLLSIS